MVTQHKIDIVKELTDKLSRAKALYLIDPTGLKHKQLEEVRKILKKAEAELTVTKNTLLKRALAGVKKTISDTHLTGPTASLLAYRDEVAPLRELVHFIKNAAAGKIKTGLLGAAELTTADVERLATLPPRDTLLAQLVGQLQAPISGLYYALSWNLRKLVWTLDTVKNKKSDTAVSSLNQVQGRL